MKGAAVPLPILNQAVADPTLVHRSNGRAAESFMFGVGIFKVAGNVLLMLGTLLADVTNTPLAAVVNPETVVPDAAYQAISLINPLDTVPDPPPAGVAQVPSPRQKVVALAEVPEFK